MVPLVIVLHYRMLSFTTHFSYHVYSSKSRVYIDTRLGLEGVALLGYPY
ncbi:hypothetical protein MtrunA17_Chr3g0093491 [Medicago truncatula]|uniref:Uncharacterized protein n=1 Tax=Medicago truncatula TaxID=3880 RepID=A0A396ILZ5_MEDTR|nr:hypothetical protein MtrunA17_Chr3g0093491 [Medicago truncatula]